MLQTFHQRVLQNPYIPFKPSPRQALFLLHNDVREVGYGGAAFGGKTQAMLAAAVMYHDIPNYAALIFRKTLEDMKKPNAILDRALKWWQGKPGVKWNAQQHQFEFYSGAKIKFAQGSNMADALAHNSAEYHFIGTDEGHLTPSQPAIYLISRLRRLKADQHIPSRIRIAFNPPVDQLGAWVKYRYCSAEALECQRKDRNRYFSQVWWNQGRAFIPARMQDNPHGDIADYKLSLAELDPVTRMQLEEGDMTVHGQGRYNRDWFPRYNDIGDALIAGEGYFGADNLVYKAGLTITIWVDPANRAKKQSKNTCFLVTAQDSKSRLFILDVVLEKLPVEGIIPRLYQLSQRWNPMYAGFESNGFQMALVNEARDRTKYPNMCVIKEVEPKGKSKLTRATPSITKASQAEIFVPRDPGPPWLEGWFSELEMFTGDDTLDVYTDQVDTLAYNVLDLSEQFGSIMATTG
ncbi:MAG: hypothetical protein JNJ77_20155 [Planctomycetia bacterium]|nr:hypothetical protein [Planctomycetia bacterium]